MTEFEKEVEQARHRLEQLKGLVSKEPYAERHSPYWQEYLDTKNDIEHAEWLLSCKEDE